MRILRGEVSVEYAAMANCHFRYTTKYGLAYKRLYKVINQYGTPWNNLCAKGYVTGSCVKL
jgi:hypothetical protein